MFYRMFYFCSQLGRRVADPLCRADKPDILTPSNHDIGNRKMRHIAAALAAFIMLAGPVRAADITVFAAASLSDALQEAAELWQDTTGHRAVVTPAGSSALARQIAAGAPADIFVSASPDWMDWLDGQGGIDATSRRTLTGNTLVLVAAGRDGPAPQILARGYDIAGQMGDRDRLAMALVDAVPAGIYGQAALRWLGQWDALAPRIAQTDNVRAALALVALGEAPLGIVYATDAAAEPRVHVLGTFPAASHPPILYPAAVTTETRQPLIARDFLDWLGGPAAQAILRDHGFVPPPD